MSDTKKSGITFSVGDTLRLEILEINGLGAGVAKKDGLVVFVKGGVTGDTVEASVIKLTKSFAVAKLMRIITRSPYREDECNTCRAPLSCGGCVLRSVSYEHELNIKKQYVISAFLKAGIRDADVLDVATAGNIYRYRNKAQYPVCQTKNGVKAGFYTAKSHTVIPISDCLIQKKEFSDIVEFVCEFATTHKISVYNEQTGKGLLRHIYLRSADKTGQIMLCLVLCGSSLPHESEFIDEARTKFPNISGILINENKKNTNVVLGEHYRLIYGEGELEDVLCSLRFRIAPQAFYQVNHDGAELLYNEAKKLAELDGDTTLIDLYCGTGTIGLSMARDVRRVLGIDIVEESVRCAERNAQLNGIKNASFACFDASEPENIIKCLSECGIDLSHDKTTVIMDPPRKGSTRQTIELLASEGVERVVYISCNPDTLARDAADFISLGYKMGSVLPVNMFPRTAHVESVVCLTRK